MPGDRAFCFVHGSDFHLEQPPYGLADIPPEWRERLLWAVEQAASRVFDAVLAHQADFLVLSGDIIDWRAAGPRAVAFLLEQFQRLADAHVHVYWAGSLLDAPDRWPADLTLPENVHRFPSGHMEEFVVRRNGRPVARLVGASRNRTRSARQADWQLEISPLFTIGVLHGASAEESLKRRDVHYWALGGSHSGETQSADEFRLARFAGTPQGRSPHEEGPHGCTLVEVDTQRRLALRTLETDVLRWRNETIALQPGMDADELELLLHERVQTLVQAQPGLAWLIAWKIEGGGPLAHALRRDGLDQRLQKNLRESFDNVLCTGLTVEPAASFPVAWYEQESFLGDFLRAVRHYQAHPEERIDLAAMVGEEPGEHLRQLTSLQDGATRRHVLQHVAQLGVDLLGGKEAKA